MLHDGVEDADGLGAAAPHVPELFPEIEIEAYHRPQGLGRLDALQNEPSGGLREGREDTPAVKPADPAGKDVRPVEVAWFQTRGCLVRSIVEHHGRPTVEAPVAVDGGEVRTIDPVVREDRKSTRLNSSHRC